MVDTHLIESLSGWTFDQYTKKDGYQFFMYDDSLFDIIGSMTIGGRECEYFNEDYNMSNHLTNKTFRYLKFPNKNPYTIATIIDLSTKNLFKVKVKKSFTIKERAAIVDNLDEQEYQTNSKERRDEIVQHVKAMRNKCNESDVSFGFNACLEMIKEETDINWKKVKWNNLYSSTVTWYAAAIQEARFQKTK